MRPTSSSPSTNQGCFTVRMVTVLATLLSMASSVQANNVVYSFANQASAKRNSITNAVVTCKFSNSETSTYTQNCVEGQELTITADMYWYNALPAPTTGSDGSTTYKMQMKMCEYGGNQCNTIEFDDDLCAGGYEVTLTPAVSGTCGAAGYYYLSIATTFVNSANTWVDYNARMNLDFIILAETCPSSGAECTQYTVEELDFPFTTVTWDGNTSYQSTATSYAGSFAAALVLALAGGGAVIRRRRLLQQEQQDEPAEETTSSTFVELADRPDHSAVV